MGPEVLLRITHALVSIGVAILALETLSARRLFSSTGLYAWSILSTNIPWARGGVANSVFRVLLGYHGFLVLVCMQFVAALVLLSGHFPQCTLAAVAIMLAVHMLFALRNQYGLDGSDQMTLIVLAALLVYDLHPTGAMLTILFGFLTAQLFASYLTSGIAKAISPVWRNGAAIVGILNTDSYGSRMVTGYLSKHGWAARAVCWSVLGYECGGPLVALIDTRTALGFIVIGTMLHLSIGFCMGLNVFFWSFTSTYPAVYYMAHRFS
jgi:hypothetical protein